MATFSPTDAALEGFRLARERPKVIFAWAVLYGVITILTAVLMVVYAGDALTALREAEEAGRSNDALADTGLAKLAPVSLLGLIFSSVFAAAVYRVILRPEDDRFAYLRLGKDELRLILLTLIAVVAWIAITVIAVIVFAILGGIIGGIAGLGGGEAAVGLLAIIGVLAGLSVLPALIWLWVRFSLAWPMTFAEQRIRFLPAWRLSKGRFWPLFGAYALAIILAVLVLLLGIIVYAGVAAVLTGGDLASVGAVFSPDMSSLAAYFTVPMIIYSLFAGFLGALQYLIMFAPAAIAYRALAAEKAAA